jgi:SOS-response transcriptional repressor LexA
VSRAPGSYAGLTYRQAQLLSYIRTRAAQDETPSFEEMREAIGLASKSGVARLIASLVERGYVRSPHSQARALTLVEADRVPLSNVSLAQLVDEIQRRGLRMVAMPA